MKKEQRQGDETSGKKEGKAVTSKMGMTEFMVRNHQEPFLRYKDKTENSEAGLFSYIG